MSKQQAYLRDASVFCLDKHIGKTNKKQWKILKGHQHILQSLAPKDYRLRWVTTQLVLLRV